MKNTEQARQELLAIAEELQEKKERASTLTKDCYEPGNMENLAEYLGRYDAQSGRITLRTLAMGLRYEERTPRLDRLQVGDPVRLVREKENAFNENNITILSEEGENLGNLPAKLCNAAAPLWDAGLLAITDSRVSYLERLRDRSRYAKQGVLFVEICMEMKN